MQSVNVSGILVENSVITSEFLQREVIVDFFLPKNVTDPSTMSLLLINDGQNMTELGLETVLSNLYSSNSISPLLCAAVHTNKDRKREYGIAGEPDYLGRGDKADLYTRFIIEELIPFIHASYAVEGFKEKSMAGFSLGGLTALDIVWNHPAEFSKAGVFSGSLWWRKVDQEHEHYNDDLHRLMHQQIRKGNFRPGLKFFFQCGNMDESLDRNNNGIIDSIDDTLDLVRELKEKGYDENEHIFYLEMPDGKHDIPTWALAMPIFLRWGWGS
ncbi:MAG: esterase [Chitinophagaceae bacterium]|nr:esterase [Chitinophagaceae bacterium]